MATTAPTAAPTPEPIVPGRTFTLDTGSYMLDADGEAVYQKPAKSSASVVIPAQITVNGKKVRVTSIAPNAFKGNKTLKTVTLGKYIRTIGKKAFASCPKLTTVKGGAAVKKIDSNAFSGDAKLKTLPAFNKLESIGANAFKGCKALAKVTLGKNVNAIGKNAFNGCAALKTIIMKTVKLTAKNVGAGAFKGIHKKASVKVPAKVLKTYTELLPKKGLPKTVKVKK